MTALETILADLLPQIQTRARGLRYGHIEISIAIQDGKAVHASVTVEESLKMQVPFE